VALAVLLTNLGQTPASRAALAGSSYFGEQLLRWYIMAVAEATMAPKPHSLGLDPGISCLCAGVLL
jgi:hypothetical protein